MKLMQNDMDNNLNRLRIKLMNQEFSPKFLLEFIQSLTSIVFGYQHLIAVNNKNNQIYKTSETLDYKKFLDEANLINRPAFVGKDQNLYIKSNDVTLILINPNRTPNMK